MFLIEFHNHSEVVQVLGSYLTFLKIPFTLIANKDVIDACQDLECNFLNLQENWRQKIKSDDHCLFITTLPEDFTTIKSIQCKVKIGIIHNVNTLFYNEINRIPFWSIMGIKYWLSRRYLPRKTDIENEEILNYFSCPASWMTSYAKKAGYDVNWLSSIPFSYVRKLPVKISDTSLHIVIPGTVAFRQRDYMQVIEAINEIDLMESLTLTFLGRSSSKVANKIRTLLKLKGKIKLRFFYDHLSAYRYHEELASADFLIIPVKEKYRLGNIYETYGKSNITGGESDMLAYALPSIWPSHYPLIKELDDISERYANKSELTNIIHRWIKHRSFEKLKQKRTVLLQNYNLENQANRFLSLLMKSDVDIQKLQKTKHPPNKS